MNRLSAVAEEAKRVSQDISGEDEGKRDASPFSDDHATE